MPTEPHVPTDFVRRLTALLADDRRIVGMWLEGDDAGVQFPPYERIDLHVTLAEPDLPGFADELGELLARADAVTDFSRQAAPLKGFAGTAVLSDGTPITYRLERSSQIGKVPRRHVNVLLDATGLLVPALSFE